VGGSVLVGIENPCVGAGLACKRESVVGIRKGSAAIKDCHRAKEGWDFFSYVPLAYVCSWLSY
jgi:hypothetical protein